MFVNYIGKTNDADKEYYLLVLNQQGKISFANTQMIHHFGLPTDELLSRSFFELLDTVQSTRFKAVLDTVKTNKGFGEVETTTRNGSLHWIKWEISLLKSESETPDKFFCIGFDINGKSRTQKMKHLARNHYEAMVDALDVGIILQDNNLNVIAVNNKAAEIFRANIETFYESNQFEKLWETGTLNGEPVTKDNCPCATALRTGVVQRKVRINFTNADDRIKSLLVSAKPVYEFNETTPSFIITSLLDVTYETELEKEVKDRDALFTMFMNKTPNLAWIVDEEERLIYGNDSFYRYLSLDKSVIGKNIVSLLPKPVAAALVNKHKQIFTDGLPRQSKEKVFLADGTEMVFWINMFPLDPINGKKRVGGEAVNITRQKKAEQELQKTNERLTLLNQLIKDAVWEWDIAKGTIYRNQALYNITGFDAGQSKGLTWWFRRIHDNDRRRVRDLLKNIVDNKKQRWECEYRFIKANGEIIKVIDRGFVLYENEQPVKMIGSLQDITHVKELEDKLMQEKFKYEKQIIETIFSVQEKERSRIGHELHDNVNQLLGASKLFIESVHPVSEEEKEFKEKSKEYILMAIEEIRRLSREMVAPQLQDNNLIASIKKLVDDLQSAGIIKVSFTHPHGLNEISGNKKLTLFRIVQEQIKNTLSYSQAKHMWINLEKNNEEVQLVIKDDGVGFDSAKTNRGIGLSNIYERTRFYNGKVNLKTAPGEGCSLTITLPLD